jgi:hypothetical protein
MTSMVVGAEVAGGPIAYEKPHLPLAMAKALHFLWWFAPM